MSGDQFTETTSQSWFDRIKGAITGVLIGLILFIVAFPLLLWNEGRAIQTSSTLEEGAGLVTSVDPAQVDPANDKKLVHMTGEAATGETLGDPQFGISVNAIKLNRSVEMYQWKETQKKEEKSKLGGGTETVTTYSYSQAWSGSLVNSANFKKPEGHSNPASKKYDDKHYAAQKVTLGAFTLSRGLLSQLSQSTPLPVSEGNRASLPADLRDRLKASDGLYYLSDNPQSPQVGDVRVRFDMVQPCTVSIVARQVGSTFEPYNAKAGGSVEMLKAGTYSAENMFQEATSQNEMITWLLRLAGFLLLLFGIYLMLNPLVVLADVVPFLGSLLGLGIGITAGIMAFALALITIAIGWLAYRPWLSIPLLLVAGGAVFGFWWLGKRKRSGVALKPVPQPAAVAPRVEPQPQPSPARPAATAEAPAQRSKFCPGCGDPVAEGENFCDKCGKKLG